jgi:hypothetical protein
MYLHPAGLAQQQGRCMKEWKHVQLQQGQQQPTPQTRLVISTLHPAATSHASHSETERQNSCVLRRRGSCVHDAPSYPAAKTKHSACAAATWRVTKGCKAAASKRNVICICRRPGVPCDLYPLCGPHELLLQTPLGPCTHASDQIRPHQPRHQNWPHGPHGASSTEKHDA